MKKTAIGWANFVKDHIPEEVGAKLVSLVEAIPESNMMLHGDYHTGNVELTGDEVLLIDMDTLAVGDPVFEFGSIFNAFIGFSEMDSSIIEKFQGFNQDTADEFWHKVLAAYIGTDDEDQIRAAEDKARIIGYTRLIRRSIRRGGLEDEQKRAEIEHWRGELIELLDRVDSLSMKA
jgi:thiamine kinase-like enzyme